MDARAALEPQRQRLLLQQRRDRGEITPDDFAAEDKKALDVIMALRGKYVPEGQQYVDRFDQQLAQLTQAIAKDPSTPLPVSKVAAAAKPAPTPQAQQSSSTTDADYQHDVEQAFNLWAQQDTAAHRLERKEIDAATYQKIARNTQPCP